MAQPTPMELDVPLSTSTITEDDGLVNRRIACVAVIGQNNGLLYLKSYPDVADTALPNRPDGDQGMQEVIYNSLDVIEERVASIKSTNPKDVDNYIGCLAVVGALSLFGLVTNTRQKLVIIVKSGKGVPESKEAAVRVLLRKLHVAVVTALLNPFESMDAPIKSSRFDAHVDDIARRYG